MALYDFVCSEGHVTEKLVSGAVSAATVKCPCGRESERQAVNRISFAFAEARGQDVHSYYDAAREAEYRHNRTDNPAIKAALPESVWAPAKYRSEAKVLAGETHWIDPGPQQPVVPSKGKGAKERNG